MCYSRRALTSLFLGSVVLLVAGTSASAGDVKKFNEQVQKGDEAKKTKDLLGAATAYETALKDAPKDYLSEEAKANWHFKIGICYRQAGNHADEAEAALRKSLSIYEGL